jgi:hypothetical protein
MGQPSDASISRHFPGELLSADLAVVSAFMPAPSFPVILLDYLIWGTAWKS